MKRHTALIPLTHDHHHALVQARQLRRAAASEDGEDREARARAFLQFFSDDTLRHFREEEEIAFPMLLERFESPPEILVEILIQHVRIHGLVRRLENEVEAGSVGRDTLEQLGELLQAHIRLEEGKLFPLMEKVVPEEDLVTLEFAERDRSATLAEGD